MAPAHAGKDTLEAGKPKEDRTGGRVMGTAQAQWHARECGVPLVPGTGDSTFVRDDPRTSGSGETPPPLRP